MTQLEEVEPRGTLVARVVAGLVLLVALVLVARALPPLSCARVQQLGEGTWAVPLALLLYVVAILVAVPRWMVIASAGLTFGALPGMLIVHLGAWVGACLAFVTARSIARAPIERWLARQRWYGRMALLLADDRQGLWIFLLLRMNPVLHFTGVSYAAGLAPTRFSAYALGTALGMLPMTLVVGWAGDVVGCALLDGQAIEPRVLAGLVAAATLMTLASIAPLVWSWWKRRRSA
jgi:uncharacterized membrane protein YdjX (TVP38/TMEM64 family)